MRKLKDGHLLYACQWRDFLRPQNYLGYAYALHYIFIYGAQGRLAKPLLKPLDKERDSGYVDNHC